MRLIRVLAGFVFAIPAYYLFLYVLAYTLTPMNPAGRLDGISDYLPLACASTLAIGATTGLALLALGRYRLGLVALALTNIVILVWFFSS